MTKVPEGYTELELVGFTDKGSYADGTSYVKNDLVHYKGSIYRCMEDDTLDVPPNDTSCWEVFIPGQSSLESISAVDTEGKLGAKGKEVSAQKLMDELAKEDTLSTDDRTKLNALGTPDGKSIIVEENGVMKVPIDSELSDKSLNPLQNKVIAQKIAELNHSIEELNGFLGGKLDVSKIANNLVTTEAGYALDARMGKALGDGLINKFDSSKIQVVIANTAGKSLNTDILFEYPSGFNRGNCYIIGVSVFHGEYGLWYGLYETAELDVILSVKIKIQIHVEYLSKENSKIAVVLLRV